LIYNLQNNNKKFSSQSRS